VTDSHDRTCLAKPLPRQVVWQDCEVGVIFHLDMPVFCEGGWDQRKAIFRTYDPALYNPTHLDTDQWLDTAKAMGAQYAVFTATHFNGFLQWQSDLYPYGMRQTSWRHGRGDVVADFVASCHRHSIKPALYMSCFRNAWWKVDQYRVNYGKGGEEQARFASTCERMVEELCSRYGELLQIWFDAGLISPAEGGPDVLPIVDKYQPNMVFYHSPQRREHRWIGNEKGYAGYPCWSTMPDLASAERAHKEHSPQTQDLLEHGDPDGRLWSPAMVDTVIRDHHWCWRPNTEGTIQPLESLVRFYYDSVGRNANLVLGLVIGPRGLVPEPDAERCRQFGQEIRRRFGTPLARVSGDGPCVELVLNQPGRIDHVSIMEDITLGERIREYVVEGLTPEGSWQTLCQGISIGHRRIQRFEAQDAARIRLRVTQSVGTPVIRDLAVYHCG
jgi:alpha-L-fucosidase